MSSIFVVREYAQAHNQVLDSIESATQAMRAFDSSIDGVTESAEGLEKVSDRLQSAASQMSRETDSASNRLRLLKKGLSDFGQVVGFGVNAILDYNDAARTSIRGTSLMSASAEEMRRSVNGLTTLGPKVASSLSYSSKEAVQFSTSLINEMERVSGSLDIGVASKQVEEYANNIRGSASLLNASSSDMMKLQRQMVGQAHLSLEDMQSLMAESASYATTLGLEGSDVQEMTAKHMETVNGNG